MKKIESVLSLINSLSKSEKKHITLQLKKGNDEKDYLIIYNLITIKKIYTVDKIKQEFAKQRPDGSFEIAVHYLYDKILCALLSLRKNKDLYYDIFQLISKARLLYDKSLFYEYLELLSEAIALSKKYELYELFMIVKKLELEYLLRFNFPNLSEQELYHKHHELVDAIKKIRKNTEQSSLYDILKYRLIHKGNIRTSKQKQEMNDLVVSELYISASSDGENSFEIRKKHLLFQSSYLIGIGDFKSALQTLIELNNLFEENPDYWTNPPIYYMSTLEGILNSLRFSYNYDEMNYFIEKLKVLANSSSMEFKINTTCLIFQYELFPWLDKGDFKQCYTLMNQYKEVLYEKENWLNTIRKSELFLYTAIIYIGLNDFTKARKYINSIMIDRNVDNLPVFKMIRLIRLITYYESGDFELIKSETRSIKRGLTSKKELFFNTEHTLLWFLNKENLPVLKKDKDNLWSNILSKFENWYNDRYECQILHLFDFSAWIEAKIFKKPLSIVMKQHFNERISRYKHDLYNIST